LELNGHYEQALQYYDQMHTFSREIGDRSIEISALMAKATLYSTFSRLHDSSLSEQLLLQALDISRKIEDRTLQARLSWNLMITYLFSNRSNQALEHGKQALSLARSSGDREQLAFVLNDFGRLYTCRGQFEQAIQAISEARGLWQELDHQVMLADSFGSEAEARFNAGEFDLALKSCEQALMITEKIENLWGQSYDRMLMSFVYLEIGQLGPGIRLAEQSIQLADEAGLIASSIGLRSELAAVYANIGAFEHSYKLLARALQIAEAKQPAWKAYPQAAKVRVHLLQGDVRSADQCAGNDLLKPISIPYARYTIFLCLANIQLAIAKGDHPLGLRLIEELLITVTPLTRVDIPEILYWKGNALIGLGQFQEGRQVLTEAFELAKKLDAKPQLWPILVSLAKVNAQLGKEQEAEANLEEARAIVRQVAESVMQIELSDTYLNQPRIKALFHECLS
jgi:tetratricopeptide (TPR) repeat protein